MQQEEDEADENFEEYDEDEDYDSEEEGASDDYYDEEEELDEDDDAQEIEIQIGRDPNNFERLSNMEGAAQQRGGQQRRDEVLSMNNMSVDMFNVNQMALPSIREEQESVDTQNAESQDGGNVDARIPAHRHVHHVHYNQQDIGGVLNDILGMFLGRGRQRPQVFD